MTDTRRYRVLSTVGRGGCGVVYLAELEAPGGFSKVVALKVLHRGVAANSELARRLRDEGRMLGLVRHRAIVNADGLIRVKGRWTIVMEYVDGVTLKRLIADGLVPPTIAVLICREIAEALIVAYRTIGPEGMPLNLVHRDIKPSNVKLTSAGEVKILDFGLAKADFESREADSTHQQFGSLPYMAPECLEGKGGSKADVYSLGVVLFELLVGDRFGRAYSNPHRHDEHLQGALRRTLDIGLPSSVVSFVGLMLMHDRDDRPNLDEVVERCTKLLEALPKMDLRSWAAENVPLVVHHTQDDIRDDFVGHTVHEDGTAEGLAPDIFVDPEAPSRSPSPLPDLAAAARTQESNLNRTLVAAAFGFLFGAAIALVLVLLFSNVL